MPVRWAMRCWIVNCICPRSGRTTEARCRAGGNPAGLALCHQAAARSQLSARAFTAGLLAKWVTGDSVYGDDRRLRLWLEGQAPALCPGGVGQGIRLARVATMAGQKASWPPCRRTAGRRLSAGDGAQGPRWYDWRWLPLTPPVEPGWCRWLLVRRSLSDATDLTAYVVFAPQVTTLPEVVRVAGSRWTIECGFEEAKGEVGLDHDEVRSWIGWYRHLTLAMWALALLTSMRAGTIAVEAGKKLPL